MKIDPQFSIAGKPVHPHFKLTHEEFPRALATRILNDDGDEYFGAFLNRTNVRILIDFLNRTFRLRTCTIPIDGSFPVPCTQYYAKRCMAPCVKDLCDRESYLEMVDLVRLFLRNDRELFLASITKRIERAAEDLDFETAAFFRDILESVERYWSNSRYQVWLEDTVDTIELQIDNGVIELIIVSQRGRRPLGEIVYSFPLNDELSQAIPAVIRQFYKYHLPREIRVSHAFDERPALAAELGKRFGEKVKIVVGSLAARRVTAERALDRTRERLALEAIAIRPTGNEIQRELAVTFGLKTHPSRIEAFDVAHISATGFAAGVSVWIDGKDVPAEYEHWQSDRESELDTLRAFVAERVGRTKPDLVVIDGGRSQLNAALEVIGKLEQQSRVIAAVKPRGKHSSISHFLTDDGRRIEFDPESAAHYLMQRLRDAAHALANSAHRLTRDMMHFYELAAMLPSINERERQELVRELGSIRAIAESSEEFFVTRFGSPKGKRAAADVAAFRSGDSLPPRPLIVPLSFVETDGAADDLIPIETR